MRLGLPNITAPMKADHIESSFKYDAKITISFLPCGDSELRATVFGGRLLWLDPCDLYPVRQASNTCRLVESKQRRVGRGQALCQRTDSFVILFSILFIDDAGRRQNQLDLATPAVSIDHYSCDSRLNCSSWVADAKCGLALDHAPDMWHHVIARQSCGTQLSTNVTGLKFGVPDSCWSHVRCDDFDDQCNQRAVKSGEIWWYLQRPLLL